MKYAFLFAAFAFAPLSAFAMPAVGDVIGTNPTDATAALEAAGCMGPRFESEHGKIEAKCLDAENHKWEVYIDPNTGVVTKVSAND